MTLGAGAGQNIAVEAQARHPPRAIEFPLNHLPTVPKWELFQGVPSAGVSLPGDGIGRICSPESCCAVLIR